MTFGPGWHGSVDWAQDCKAKGRWFNSQSEHMPGLWARSPVGVAWEATTHWCFSPSLSSSLPLSLKIYKIFKKKRNDLWISEEWIAGYNMGFTLPSCSPFFKKNPHPRVYLLILERDSGSGVKGQEGERERETSMLETSIGCLLYVPQPPTRDQTRNLSICPGWELNLQPFGVWDTIPTNWARATGPVPPSPFLSPIAFSLHKDANSLSFTSTVTITQN